MEALLSTDVPSPQNTCWNEGPGFSLYGKVGDVHPAHWSVEQLELRRTL